jgi:hypothetical protein
LNCSSGYYPSGFGEAGYPSGRCCYQDCPSAQYFGTDCGSVSHGSFTNNSTCTNRCATATQQGYVVAKKCNLSCDSGWHRDGPTSAEYPDGNTCTETCTTSDSQCSGYSCDTKNCNENTGSTKTITGECYNYPPCSGYPSCAEGCGFVNWWEPYCQGYCGSGGSATAYSLWVYSCNANPTCPTPPSCACGYATTCVDNGCSISGSYSCNADPSCGSGPSCSYGVSGSCTDNGCTITDDRACCSSSVVTTACCGVDQGCGYNECGVEVGRWADPTNC